MNEENRLLCERDCTRLNHDFAWTVDHLDYDAFVALFARDGVFERGGQSSSGHDAIRAFLNARPAGRVTRHLCTDISIDMTGPDTAKGRCVALMFAAAGDETSMTPLPTSLPLVVDYDDDYVLTATGWKFKHRRTRIVMQP